MFANGRPGGNTVFKEYVCIPINSSVSMKNTRCEVAVTWQGYKHRLHNLLRKLS